MSESTDSLIQQIVEIEKRLRPLPLEHPQLIDGALYVTPKQYEALRDLGTEQQDQQWRANGYFPPISPVTGIPVIVVYTTRLLDDGRTIAYSKATGELYVLPEDVMGRITPSVSPMSLLPDRSVAERVRELTGYEVYRIAQGGGS